MKSQMLLADILLIITILLLIFAAACFIIVLLILADCASLEACMSMICTNEPQVIVP